MASLTFLAIGIVLIVIGLLPMKRGFTIRQRANLVAETPTEDVESVSMGQSKIKGTARPTDEGTIEAPMSDDDCLVAVWEVLDYGSDDGWEVEGNGIEAVPFYVDDGTGQALVRPSEGAVYEFDETDEEPVVVRRNETPPPRVQKFLEREDWKGWDLKDKVWRTGAWGVDGHTGGDRVYNQHLLQPNDDVHVFGVAQPRDDVRTADNPANVVFEKVPEKDEDLEDMFMISDQGEEELTQFSGAATKWYAFGVALAMLGFVFVLGGVGVI